MTETTALTTTKIGGLAHPLPLDQRPAAVYLAGLGSEASRRTMRQALDAIAHLLSGGRADALAFPWWEMRFQHVSAVRAALSERYGTATTNKMLSALRGVLKAAWKLGQMDAEGYRLAASVRNVKGEVLPTGRAITSGELLALLDTCGQDAGGVRDAAMIAVLYSCGLRRAELVALDIEDYDVQAATLLIRGKGGKERLAHVVSGAAAALADWLTLRGEDPGPLFHPVRKGGAIMDGRLTTQAVYHVLRKRAAQAGVKELSPHDFRRTFVSDLLDAGADIATVQKMAGHAQVTTTARYDRRPEEAKRQAANLLHVPYRRRVLG